jgi:membrane protease YdiL (CAAX protease family)
VGVILALLLLEVLLSQLFSAPDSVLGLDAMGTSAMVMVLANGAVFTVLLHWKGLGYRALFHSGRGSAQATLAVTALPVLLMVPGLVLSLALAESALTALVPLSEQEIDMFTQMGASSFAALTTTCLIAPLLEEMLFRGLILRSFLARYSRAQALWGSALLFGLAHLNIYQGVVGVVLGLLTGWLFERTRSLGPGILLHAAYNSTLAWLSAWLPDDAPATVPDDSAMALLGAGMALAALALGLRLLRRLLVPPGAWF